MKFHLYMLGFLLSATAACAFGLGMLVIAGFFNSLTAGAVIGFTGMFLSFATTFWFGRLMERC